MDDDLKAKLAIERFSGNFPGVKELAGRHGRSRSVVSRAITSAFKKGLVRLQRVNRFKPVRAHKLECKLKDQFSFLQTILVVNLDNKHPDVVHERLGYALADEVGHSMFWHGDRMLVGPGRSVHHFANRLAKRNEKLVVTGATIIAACGDSYPDYEVRKNVCLDANANALLLADAFESVPPQGLTSNHLFTSDTPPEIEWRRTFEHTYWAEPPSHALLGVGILNAKHRLVMLADGRYPTPPISKASPALDKVRRLMDLIRSQPENEQAPLVAEVGMHIFAVAASSGLNPELESVISDLNSSMFAPSFDQLASIRSIAIIAGGAPKGPAVRHLLSQMSAAVDALLKPRGLPEPALRIRYLCIDRACAEAVLGKT
jgi:hypothetical protein